MSDLISRQAAIDALAKFVPYAICDESTESYTNGLTDAYNLICQLPSAQPEQRYTKKELEIFKHGISLSLLSKRSSQHWHYDEDTATEIEFLERLYEKVVADMREGEEDE